MTADDVDPSDRAFGRFIRSLRKARGQTQEVLAERCDLSADTIRRLEHGSFSPSLDTLRKLCVGLDLTLGTLFTAFEGEQLRDDTGEIMGLLLGRSPSMVKQALVVLRTFFGAVSEALRGE